MIIRLKYLIIMNHIIIRLILINYFYNWLSFISWLGRHELLINIALYIIILKITYFLQRFIVLTIFFTFKIS